MADFAILTDAFCELNESIRRRFSIDFVPGHMIFPNGEEHLLNLEWNSTSMKDFYSTLKSQNGAYKSSPENVAEIIQKLEEYVKRGFGILCITVSSAISGSYRFFLQAERIIHQNYPDANIKILDSLRYGHGYGLMCIHASQYRSKGLNLNEVYKILCTSRNNYHQSGWIDDLSFAARNGRISNSKAFFGSLAGMKPMGEFNTDGLITVLGTVSGEKKSFWTALSYMEKTIVDAESQTIIIGYSNRKEQAEKFCHMIQEKFHPAEILLSEIFYGCAINIGPGLMAAYYLGTEISKNLKNEKEIFLKIKSK